MMSLYYYFIRLLTFYLWSVSSYIWMEIRVKLKTLFVIIHAN